MSCHNDFQFNHSGLERSVRICAFQGSSGTCLQRDKAGYCCKYNDERDERAKQPDSYDQGCGRKAHDLKPVLPYTDLIHVVTMNSLSESAVNECRMLEYKS